MITLSRGLVLRHGERQLEFERDLGDGRVQFKYLDNFEVVTFKVSQLIKEIYARKYVPTSVPPSSDCREESYSAMPVSWTPRQLQLIEFRLRFVKGVLNTPVRSFSRSQCEIVAGKVWSAIVDEAIKKEQKPPFKPPSGATVEVWTRKFLASEQNPYVLVDRREFTVRPKRIQVDTERIVDLLIAKRYLSLRGPSVKQVTSEIREAVKQHNRAKGTTLQCPSERTINRRVEQIPQYIRDVKRVGVEYARNKWRYSLKGDQSSRIMERVEVDHTILDIWVIDPRTGVPLGRPWITLLIDRYSGYLLGLYISFYGPSSATVARALQVSILPKDDWVETLENHPLRWTAMGVPELIVVDNGLEFHAANFKRIGWELRCDLIFNPVRQPWFKAAIERAIKESNRALPMHGRVHSAIDNAIAPDPYLTAAVVFDDLCTCLVEWASQTYPLQIHPKTLCRPWDLWEEGRLSSPPAMLPTQLNGLEILCGLAASRRVDGDGVFFQYLRFNSVELQDYRRQNRGSFQAEIRFYPDDLSSIYVNLPKAKSWLNVPLQRPLFNDGYGLSLVQLQIIRQELGRRLTRANAYEEMEKSILRLQASWEDATKRGLRVRKHSALVRLQGLTSVPMEPSRPQPTMTTDVPLQVSQVMLTKLPEVMPFRSFSLEDN